jgi:hypothetical protein
MSLQKMMQQSKAHIEKAVHAHLIDVLSEKNPDNNYSHAPGGGVHMWEKDADVEQWEKHFNGQRKTRPTAMSNAKALMKQEQRMAEGTLAETHVTPDVQEELLKRLSMKGSLHSKGMPRHI